VLAPQAMGAPMRAPVPGPRLLAAVRFGTVAAVLTVVAALAALLYRRSGHRRSRRPWRRRRQRPAPSSPRPWPRSRGSAAGSGLDRGEGAGVRAVQPWASHRHQLHRGRRAAPLPAFDAKAGLLPELHQAPWVSCFTPPRVTSGRWRGEQRAAEDSSQHLLLYVQRLRLYNYLVDRFGRVFRVVEDVAKANHAGNAIWATGDTVYLNLNHASLGICFESRWAAAGRCPSPRPSSRRDAR